MEDAKLVYSWPAKLSADALETAVGGLGRMRLRPPTTSTRFFLDTFDWRLFRGGAALEALDEGRGARLVWRGLLGPVLQSSPVLPPPLPRFAADLPLGAFRRALEELIEMRALLPVATVWTRAQAIELLGPRDKVVCRLWLETHRCETPEPGGPAQAPLPPTVRAEPVRGYGRALEGVLGVLADTLSLEPCGEDVLAAALGALGIVPADRSTKVRVALRPDMAAAEAAKLLFRRLLDTLLENEMGARDDVDSEFLHDFRVSVRRTRSALGHLKCAFSARSVERFRRGFAWLGAVTTPTRDLDVHLLSFPGYREALPASLRADLDPLVDFLRARKRREHAALVKALASPRCRRLFRDWSAALGSTGLRATREGERPIREVADERLAKVFRRTLREGRAVGDDSPPEAFHELRKTCKKMRYLMEFFQSLYPARELRSFIDALKGLQDNLGELQDLHVQVVALRQWAGELEPGGPAGALTLLAMGVWTEKLLARREHVRGEFGHAFGRFSDPANVARFEGLLRQEELGEGSEP